MRWLHVVVVVLVLAGACTASFAELRKGKLAGRILDGKLAPLGGGTVFLFSSTVGPPPAPEHYWRIPDELVSLDGEGRFSIELMPGSYYIGAIRRATGQDLGPPRGGDLFIVGRDSFGAPSSYTVRAGETTDIGILAGAKPFDRAMAEPRPGTSGIEGVILDPDGKPVPGVYVFAFTTSAMLGRPLFVSEKSGPDGRYLLRVAAGGTYYLKARDTCGGGAPLPGAILGGHGEEDPYPVIVNGGIVTRGVTVKSFTAPQRGRKKDQKMAEKGLKNAPGVTGPLSEKWKILPKGN
ncbi:carboxypeptidase-like regulatory domain-containing protein [Geobacter sp.]|uniref:carboxypeptidase-like regulatory domain-containing protein n=1 Tax=Geobacter sp. TaxID=46610 RepID=UPI00263398AC|nr:carboxypeptidase-like regulatory domain-containing protein [Geobacter sp.]